MLLIAVIFGALMMAGYQKYIDPTIIESARASDNTDSAPELACNEIRAEAKVLIFDIETHNPMLAAINEMVAGGEKKGKSEEFVKKIFGDIEKKKARLRELIYLGELQGCGEY